MPSQGSQGSQGQTGPLCLPLVKYSYATVSSDNVAPIPWVHLSSKQNLVAVFDTLRLQSSQGQITEQSVLKVLKGPETMETLYLEKLASAAQKARQSVSNPACPDKVLQVAIVIRAPVIAIRYPSDTGQVRRFQIRFTHKEDYHEAMKWLVRAKVPTEDAGNFMIKRPTTAQSSTSITPSDSVSQVIPRPSTASTMLDVPASGEGRQPSETTALPPPGDQRMRPPPQVFGAPTRAVQTDTVSSYFGMIQVENKPSPTTNRVSGAYIPSLPAQELQCSPSKPKDAQAVLLEESVTDSKSVAATLNLNETRPFTAPRETMQQNSQNLSLSERLDFIPYVPVKDRLAPPIVHKPGPLTQLQAEDSTQSEAYDASQRLNPETTTVESTVTKAKRCRKKSTAGEPVPKKLKAAANRKQSVRKQQSKDAQVPSVDELLRQQPQVNSSQATTSKKPEIDTQDLLTRANTKVGGCRATRISKGGRRQIPTKNKAIDTSDSFSTLSTAINTTTEANTMPGILVDPPTEVALDNVNEITSTASESSLTLPNISSDTLSCCPAFCPEPPQPFDPITCTIKSAPHPKTSSPNVQTSNQDQPNLVALDSLPEKQRQILLESWICQQIQQPSFPDLVKLIESSWQIALLMK